MPRAAVATLMADGYARRNRSMALSAEVDPALVRGGAARPLVVLRVAAGALLARWPGAPARASKS